jgi:hypothetical protein
MPRRRTPSPRVEKPLEVLLTNASPLARQFYEALMALPEPIRRQVEQLQMFDERTLIAQHLFIEHRLFAAGILRWKRNPALERDLQWLQLEGEGKTYIEIATLFGLDDPEGRGSKRVEKAINRMWEKLDQNLQEQQEAMQGLGWTTLPAPWVT